MPSADRPATRLATRLAFLVAGFGLACWAPLIPLAKQRLMIDDGILGLLLLCLGIGSVVAMLLTGALSARYGSKPMIVVGGLGVAGVVQTSGGLFPPEPANVLFDVNPVQSAAGRRQRLGIDRDFVDAAA